ncbi:hypothetical protein ERJ75_001706100 [Trypanosoma vivax]|nr:hypothetical protein ERJ75_001706100 [Trypanosoma vivax]
MGRPRHRQRKRLVLDAQRTGRVHARARVRAGPDRGTAATPGLQATQVVSGRRSERSSADWRRRLLASEGRHDKAQRTVPAHRRGLAKTTAVWEDSKAPGRRRVECTGQCRQRRGLTGKATWQRVCCGAWRS